MVSSVTGGDALQASGAILTTPSAEVAFLAVLMKSQQGQSEAGEEK
jgi:hypothetical protein